MGFSIPQNQGVYAFSLRGSATGNSETYTGYTVVYLYKNGEPVFIGDSVMYDASRGQSNVSFQVTLKLNIGDVIKIILGGGQLSGYTIFSGSLLEEDLAILY